MIEINNENLLNLIMLKLNKETKNFKEEELLLIKDIILNPIDLIGEYEYIDLDILKYLKELEDLELLNMSIYTKDLITISDYKKINRILFQNCQFEDINFLNSSNLLDLTFIDCDIDDYTFLKSLNLNSLSLNNIDNIDMNMINNLDLKNLDLSYSSLNGSINLLDLEELNICGNNIADISFINKMNNLKTVYLSRKQYYENLDVITKNENIKFIVESNIGE